MKKVTICGNFGADDGQTVKTKNLFYGLADLYGADNVTFLDTNMFKKNPVRFIINSLNSLKNSENIILTFGKNGLNYFVPLFFRLNKIWNRKLHYVAIGGWTDKVLEKNSKVKAALKDFNNVFVETEVLKKKLEKLNLDNVYILNNFKNLSPVQKDFIKSKYDAPLPLVVFSRIIENKGIEEAIMAVNSLNQNKVIFTLDIFGPIGIEYRQKFEKLIKNSPDYITYKGVARSDESIDILKDYYFLLFPTRFRTEGIPGTIIDAYMSALPVIASEWEAAHEVVVEGQTGFIYEFDNQEELIQLLKRIASEPFDYIYLKEQSLEFSKRYQKQNVMHYLSRFLEDI